MNGEEPLGGFLVSVTVFNECIDIIYMMYYIVGLGNVCHSAILLRIAVIFLKNIPTQSDAT